MIVMERDFNDVLDDIVLSESRYTKMGFTRGFSLGEESGWKEGYTLGLQKGAEIASELGYYKGFVHAWMIVLEGEESVKQRKVSALESLHEMTKSFPQTNIQDEDTLGRLLKIRAKFKQVVSLLNVEYDGVTDQHHQQGESQNQNIRSQYVCVLEAEPVGGIIHQKPTM